MNDEQLEAERARALLDAHGERLLRCLRAMLGAYEGEKPPAALEQARNALAEYNERAARRRQTGGPISVRPTGPKSTWLKEVESSLSEIDRIRARRNGT